MQLDVQEVKWRDHLAAIQESRLVRQAKGLLSECGPSPGSLSSYSNDDRGHLISDWIIQPPSAPSIIGTNHVPRVAM